MFFNLRKCIKTTFYLMNWALTFSLYLHMAYVVCKPVFVTTTAKVVYDCDTTFIWHFVSVISSNFGCP